MLAINRGEHHKILSVKIIVPDFVFHKFSKFCMDKWVKKGKPDIMRNAILEEGIKDSYNRLSKHTVSYFVKLNKIMYTGHSKLT